MSNILVINASGQETRVALIEQGTISEYYLERKNEKGIVGNIYKGRVVRVLPGMQAAFVDIGLEKAAFLYVADIVSDPSFPGLSEEIEIQAGATEGDPLEVDDLAEPPIEDVVPAPAAAKEPAAPTPAPDEEQARAAEQALEEDDQEDDEEEDLDEGDAAHAAAEAAIAAEEAGAQPPATAAPGPAGAVAHATTDGAAQPAAVQAPGEG